MDRLISLQAAIDALQKEINKGIPPFDDVIGSIRCGVRLARNIIEDLPSAQPEIIRCKDCEHWNLQVGNVKGDGLGSCDFHKVNFVTGEGFCYWADRRGDSDAID